MLNIEAKVEPLFAAPIVYAQLPNAETLNPDLRALFLALETEGDVHRDPQRRDTQHGLFESNFGLHLRTDPCVSALFSFLRRTLITVVSGMNGYSPEQAAALKLDLHSWFHITRKGGYQGSHNHPNASWSAIYCVDPGEQPHPQSGAVRFHDPRTFANMYRDPGNASLQPPYHLGAWQLSHRAGQVVAFPSYLVHEVFPYHGDRPRIVVALNAWLRWSEARTGTVNRV